MDHSRKEKPGHTISRRDFICRLGAVVGGTMVLSSIPASRVASRAVQQTGTSIFGSVAAVDAHTHITQPWGADAALTAGDLVRHMDEYRIAESVVLPLVNPESWDYPVTTAYILRETKPHRDRLIPFCSLDPRTQIDGEEFRAQLEKYIGYGARGFGEHKVGIPINHPRNLQLFGICGELGLPVLFHLDTIRNTDQPGLPGLEDVLRQLPETNFIGHAQGFWANISGELTPEDMQSYPDSKVLPGGALDRLMDIYPNLYGDMSAGSGANAILRDLDFGEPFILRRADRLVFGTDKLRPDQQLRQFELFQSINLSHEMKEKIFRTNIKSLIIGV